MQKVGSFDVDGRVLVIGDANDASLTNAVVVNEAKAGEWVGYEESFNTGDIERTVVAAHASVDPATLRWQQLGRDVTSDVNVYFIMDISRFPSSGDHQRWYDDIVLGALERDDAGVIDHALIAEGTDGGVNPVSWSTANGFVVGIKLDFPVE